ncbi:MAG: fasciclin domain-containing protein [Flavisolibacter sp.]|jgi:hypothetical protein
MKKFKVALCICIAFSIYVQSCKKESNRTNNTDGGNNDNTDLLKAVSTSLNNNDSLRQFAQLFKLISLDNADITDGITVLAVTNNALINPTNPESLKDYIIKGKISASDLTNGKVFTSITGKQITITAQNGKIFANGVMISSSPISSAAEYSVYAAAGFYISWPATYDDPHKNEYYIEYYENGIYHSLNGRSITSWQFFNSDHFPSSVAGTCSYPTFTSYSSGPAQALIAFVSDNPFALQINRNNLTSVPVEGNYKLSTSTFNASQNKNTGNCNLVIDGAVFGCDLGDKDSYVNVRITEVKVDQDLGLEKRGYYKGEFDAILYYMPHAGGAIEKRVMTGGRFMAPMGGNQTSSINGTAPIIDRLKTLTTGKWYFRPIVEADPDYPSCNLDDYIVFRTNGTCDFKDGANTCPDDINEIDHGDNIPWALTNNQTTIDINSGGIIFQIIHISDSALVVSDGGRTGTFTHGN